jgi:acyl-[acyl carrier protein]--UDP-N-acetylglucosamine O-acyltransferase
MGLIASAAPKLLTDVAAIIGAVSAIALGSAVIVTHPPFGVQVDHEGTVTAVNLENVDGLRFDGQDLAAIKVGLETVKDLPVEDLPVKGGRL